jgi:hypothetical protein
LRHPDAAFLSSCMYAVALAISSSKWRTLSMPPTRTMSRSSWNGFTAKSSRPASTAPSSADPAPTRGLFHFPCAKNPRMLSFAPNRLKRDRKDLCEFSGSDCFENGPFRQLAPLNNRTRRIGREKTHSPTAVLYARSPDIGGLRYVAARCLIHTRWSPHRAFEGVGRPSSCPL